MVFFVMFASFVCIAQNSVYDNTSEASGTGSIYCTVVCSDDDDEDEDGIRVLPDEDYGSAMKSNTAFKGTAGFGVQYIKKKDGYIRNITGNYALDGKGVLINDGTRWNYIEIEGKVQRRSIGRDADADGFAEDSNIKFLLFPENPDELNGFNKKIINFELNINSSYQEM